MKSDRLFTTVSGSLAAKAVVDIAKIAVRLKISHTIITKAFLYLPGHRQFAGFLLLNFRNKFSILFSSNQFVIFSKSSSDNSS